MTPRIKRLLKKGGYLAGKKNGKPVKLTHSKDGGIAVGAKHGLEGGIKGIVGTEKKPIEFEGEEIIITAPAVKDDTKREFEGEMLTNRQILSRINESGGGVSFADGGEIPKTIRCSGRTYNYGGETKTDYEIITSSCGCKHSLRKGGQVFQYFDTQYDIDKAYKMIKSGRYIFDVKEIPVYNVRHPLFNKKYSDNLNPDFEVAQGLMIKLPGGQDFLIDGNHRMAKAHSLGHKTMKVYYISNPVTIKTFSKKTFAEGGSVSFSGKVSAIAKNLKGQPVPAQYRKEYGKTYTAATAKEAATKIAGAMVRDEKMEQGGLVGTAASVKVFDSVEGDGLKYAARIKSIRKGSNGKHIAVWESEGWPSHEQWCYVDELELINSDNKLVPDKDWDADANHNYWECKNVRYAEGGQVSRQDVLQMIKDIPDEKLRPFSLSKKDPEALLFYIQDQAAGLNPSRTHVYYPPAYHPTVKMAGEKVVHAALALLPQKTKDMLIKAWKGRIVPKELRDAIKQSMEFGGAVEMKNFDYNNFIVRWRAGNGEVFVTEFIDINGNAFSPDPNDVAPEHREYYRAADSIASQYEHRDGSAYGSVVYKNGDMIYAGTNEDDPIEVYEYKQKIYKAQKLAGNNRPGYAKGGQIDGINVLSVIFNNDADFQTAKRFFESEKSSLSPFYYNDEFRSIDFEVQGQFDADLTEQRLSDELNNAAIANYHFESSHEDNMAKGGEVEGLEKELRKLQRDLNSSRLLTYREGDNSEEEIARQRERALKLNRFNEVLRLLGEKSSKYADGGQAFTQKLKERLESYQPTSDEQKAFYETYIPKLKELAPQQPERWYLQQASENWKRKQQRETVKQELALGGSLEHRARDYKLLKATVDYPGEKSFAKGGETASEKKYTFTLYLDGGEKDHSDRMTLEEAYKFVKKFEEKKEVFAIYDHESNEDISPKQIKHLMGLKIDRMTEKEKKEHFDKYSYAAGGQLSPFEMPKQEAEKYIAGLSREDLIDLLKKNDPNGIYTDKDSLQEFGQVASKQDLVESFWRSWDGTETRFATGGTVKRYPDFSNELPTVINEQGALFATEELTTPAVKNARQTWPQKEFHATKNVREIQLSLKDVGNIPNTTIRSSRDTYEFLKQIWDNNLMNVQEQMYVLYLNRSNKVVGFQELSKGGIDGTVADVELIVAAASKALAKSVILAHNHPSGNLQPSSADEALTRQTQDALKLIRVALIDHIIMTSNEGYFSFMDEGLLGYEYGGQLSSINAAKIENMAVSLQEKYLHG